MSAYCGYIQSHVWDIAAGALMTVGVAVWIYATRLGDERRVEAIAEHTIEELLVSKHHVLAGTPVITLAEMSPEERLTASLACIEDAIAVRDGVFRKFRLQQLSLLIASSCLLVALPTLVLRCGRWRARQARTAEGARHYDGAVPSGPTALIVPPAAPSSGHPM